MMKHRGGELCGKNVSKLCESILDKCEIFRLKVKRIAFVALMQEQNSANLALNTGPKCPKMAHTVPE